MNTAEQFWARVEKGEGCWLWLGSKVGNGYGYAWWNGRGLRAHRLSWLLTHGSLPSQTLDHLCRNRLCVRTDHLEDVSMRENIMRGAGITAINARKSHCDNGHAFTPDNTHYRTPNHRCCRTCKRAEDARGREKKMLRGPSVFTPIATGSVWRRRDPHKPGIVIVTRGANAFHEKVEYQSKHKHTIRAMAHYWRWRYEPVVAGEGCATGGSPDQATGAPGAESTAAPAAHPAPHSDADLLRLTEMGVRAGFKEGLVARAGAEGTIHCDTPDIAARTLAAWREK